MLQRNLLGCKVWQAGWGRQALPSTQHWRAHTWSTVFNFGRDMDILEKSKMKSHKNEEETEASLLWGEAERAEPVQSGEEEAQGSFYERL